MNDSMLERIKTAVPKSQFLRNVGLLSSGTALGQLIVVASSPLLTRIYSPAQFGAFGVYMAIIGVLIVIVSFCYDMAIPLPEDDRQAANVLTLSIASALFSGLCCFAAVALFRDSIADLTGMPVLADVLWLLPVSLIGGGVHNGLHMWAVRIKAFTAIARTKLSQSSGQTVFQIGLGLLHASPVGLCIGDAAGRIGGSITLVKLIRRQSGSVLRGVSWQGVRHALYRYRRFPLLSSQSALLNSAGQQIPPIWLALTYGSHVLGWFMLAQRVLGMPVALLSSSVGEVFYAELAKLAHQSPERMNRLFWTTLRNMLFIGLPCMIAVMLLAPSCFAFIFGEAWRQSGSYLRVLSVMFFFQFLSIPVGGTIVVLERQELHLLRELVRTIIIVVTILLSACLKQTPGEAVLMFSGAGTIGYFVHMYISWLAIKQYGAAWRRKHGGA